MNKRGEMDSSICFETCKRRNNNWKKWDISFKYERSNCFRMINLFRTFSNYDDGAASDNHYFCRSDNFPLARILQVPEISRIDNESWRHRKCKQQKYRKTQKWYKTGSWKNDYANSACSKSYCSWNIWRSDLSSYEYFLYFGIIEESFLQI